MYINKNSAILVTIVFMFIGCTSTLNEHSQITTIEDISPEIIVDVNKKEKNNFKIKKQKVAQTNRENKADNNDVSLIIRVGEYMPGVLFDGCCSFNDATKVQVVHPDKYTGELWFYHSSIEPQSSPWRKKKELYKIVMNKECLDAVSSGRVVPVINDIKPQKLP